jgi:hypothetical protein
MYYPNKTKLTPELTGRELIEYLKNRVPLYVDTVEFEGMSISIVNPDIIEDGTQAREENDQDRT